MTTTAFLLRIIRRIGFVKNFSIGIIRKRLRNPGKRQRLNDWYNRRNYDEKAIIQNIYGKMFRDTDYTMESSEWVVRFRSKEFRLPLRKEFLWLDWDNALSIVGHDPDVKITYETLINEGKIRTFFDVGGNYGTHSLLFLSQGIRTITFEPNVQLKTEFDLYCGMNGIKGHMESYAVSDRTGTIDFYFPEKDTWLGTVVNDRLDLLKSSHEFKKISVACITLDDYCNQNMLFPDLLKIDTEGNEFDVLKGGDKLIRQYRPKVIFETIKKELRDQLWMFFAENNYKMHSLPYVLGKESVLSKEEFINSDGYNFIAIHSNN